MTVLQRLRSGWTSLKFVRVALGGLILYTSVEDHQVTGIVVGSILTIVFLLSDGVCSGGGCYYPVAGKDSSSHVENTAYEEVGNE